MPVAFTEKVAFIHIPKTAGTSIEAALKLQKGEDYFIGRGKFEVHMQHLYLSELEQATDLEEFKIFAVIRNPFDRLVSTYHYHKAEKNYTSWLFEDFVNHALKKENRRSFFDGHLEPQVNYVKSFKGHHCKIFRFEELQKVTVWLSEQLQKPTSLPHYRKSDRLENYRDYYGSERLKSLVANFYTEDMANFGYTF
jgi:hypothetical protein